jgi:hypothetical protein
MGHTPSETARALVYTYGISANTARELVREAMERFKWLVGG